MKPIIARDQVRLGLARCFTLALDGMRYRLFRSVITVSILALAVAFLVQMLSFGLLAHETRLSAHRELAESRRLGQYVTRLTAPDAKAVMLDALDRGDPERLAEYRRWSTAALELEAAQRTARQLSEIARSWQALPAAPRAALLGDRSPEEVFDDLENAETFQKFVARLGALGVRVPMGSPESFARLVQVDRQRLDALLEGVATGHGRALETLRAAHPNRAPLDLLASPPPGLFETLRSAGFELGAEDPTALERFAKDELALAAMQRALLHPGVRAAVARKLSVPLSDVNLTNVARYVTNHQRAVWFTETLKSAPDVLPPPAERLLELLSAERRKGDVTEIAGEEPPEQRSGLFGLSGRDRLLIGLSFLVCVVGVTNAMLMSVTERFTEIATMKCLGALDRFVMAIFVLEAVLLGLVGGVAGAALGVLLAAFRGLLEFGWLLSGAAGALGQVGMGALAAVGVGILLAAGAAVGPSWLAARLAPMEAMRVE